MAQEFYAQPSRNQFCIYRKANYRQSLINLLQYLSSIGLTQLQDVIKVLPLHRSLSFGKDRYLLNLIIFKIIEDRQKPLQQRVTICTAGKCLNVIRIVNFCFLLNIIILFFQNIPVVKTWESSFY